VTILSVTIPSVSVLARLADISLTQLLLVATMALFASVIGGSAALR